MSGWRLDPAWLVAAVSRGIVCVQGEVEVALEVPAPFESLISVVRSLEEAADPERVATLTGTAQDDAALALETLREQGALTDRPPGPPPETGVPLVEAILRVSAGEAVEVAWTATEALVLPAGADATTARQAVRWFMAAITPDARAEAYCAAATHRRRCVTGDRPEADALAAALERARGADPEAIHVVAIGDASGAPVRSRHEPITSLAPTDLGRIGVDHVHRLGPLQWVGEVPAGPPIGGLRTSYASEYAIGNLALPFPRLTRVGRGTAHSPAAAERMSRAEAAERFAATDVRPGRLCRAAAGELADPVTPDRLHRLSARQYEAGRGATRWEPAQRLLWIEGHDRDGRPWWVPAEAVHLALGDPEAPSVVPTTSSGLAAGATRGDAADRAVRELIERDAFMWTWVHRISRERLDPAGLPPESAELAAAAARAGFALSLVNLTLETKPVVMAVLSRGDRIHVATACRDDPAQAAAKALEEASLAAALEADRPAPELAPEDVVTPEEHMRLYLRPEWVERAGFLTASSDVIGMDEVMAGDAPAMEAVEAIGPAVIVELTSPCTAPFEVVRAVVPGAVPLAFGWDREPLGCERLAAPKRTLDGRTLGALLDLARVAPILPHPFP